MLGKQKHSFKTKTQTIMIKKIYTLAFAAMAFIATASADDNLTFNWAHSVDDATTASEYPIGTEVGTDGSYYVAVGFKSNNTSKNVKVDGVELADVNGNAIEGGISGSKNNNNNLLIQKVDPQTGVASWFVYTRKGDVYHNNTQIKPTSDGGLVVAVRTRPYVQEAGYDNLLEIVDATGATTTVKDMWAQAGEYRYLILKLTADGKVDWARLVSGLVKDVVVSEDKTNTTTDNFTIYGLDTDENDNIYICGNFRTELNFKNSDGSTTTLTANTYDGWNGADQTAGDGFVAMLDSKGYYQKSFTVGAGAKMAYFDNVAYSGGKLYLNGRLLGNSGADIAFGSQTVKADDKMQTEFIASVDPTEMTLDYVRVLTSLANTSGSFTVQNKNVQVVDGYLYFTGSVNGGWQVEGSDTPLLNTNDKFLKGYVLKVDPATGDIVASMLSRSEGISNYFGAYVGEYNIYAIGYDMKLAKSVLTQFGTTDYGYAGQIEACSLSGNCGTPAIDGDNIVMMSSGKTNATFYATDTKFTDFTSWGLVYYSYKVADTVTGVNGITVNESGNHAVYSLDGVRVKTASTYNEAVGGLHKGVYVVDGKKVVVK